MKRIEGAERYENGRPKYDQSKKAKALRAQAKADETALLLAQMAKTNLGKFCLANDLPPEYWQAGQRVAQMLASAQSQAGAPAIRSPNYDGIRKPAVPEKHYRSDAEQRVLADLKRFVERLENRGPSAAEASELDRITGAYWGLTKIDSRKRLEAVERAVTTSASARGWKLLSAMLREDATDSFGVRKSEFYDPAKDGPLLIEALKAAGIQLRIIYIPRPRLGGKTGGSHWSDTFTGARRPGDAAVKHIMPFPLF